MLKDNKIDIVTIQETKKETFTNRYLRSLSSHIDIWHWLPSIGRSGRILFGCPGSKIKSVNVQLSRFSIIVHIQIKDTQ